MSQFSTEEEVRSALAAGGILLDVRGREEIEQLSLPCKYSFLHIEVTRTDSSLLETRAHEVLPKKDVPVICFCRSGRRSEVAKQTLLKMGYTKVLNAGGLTTGELAYLE
mmetsp:Transcript_32750/g.78206  ORF Transcript_32750/g.78206 Transcript_32750/m.78206 type:complete len:109 (-) Transcript_32750:16-342(-)